MIPQLTGHRNLAALRKAHIDCINTIKVPLNEARDKVTKVFKDSIGFETDKLGNDSQIPEDQICFTQYIVNGKSSSTDKCNNFRACNKGSLENQNCPCYVNFQNYKSEETEFQRKSQTIEEDYETAKRKIERNHTISAGRKIVNLGDVKTTEPDGWAKVVELQMYLEYDDELGAENKPSVRLYKAEYTLDGKSVTAAVIRLGGCYYWCEDIDAAKTYYNDKIASKHYSPVRRALLWSHLGGAWREFRNKTK